MESNLYIRDARPSDAQLIAWTILTAMGLEEDLVPHMAEITIREDTLYSWCRARIAVLDGTPAGCLISYPGEEYMQYRNATWRMFRPFENDELADFDLETFPGEYYLDSLAVKPEFRGRGLGKALLLDGVAKAHSMGYDKVSLIAETDHPHLREFYNSCGFKEFGDLLFFGDDYKRMEYIG